MKPIMLPILVAAAVSLLFLSGCYTQLGVVQDEGRSEGISRDERYEQTAADSVNAEDYAAARHQFYYDSYYPSYYPWFDIGIGFGWRYPWYGYGNPWYGYGSPYYDPYYYGAYYPYVAPYAYYGSGTYYRNANRPYGKTRTIGSSRTFGGSRALDASTSTPSTLRGTPSVTLPSGRVARPSSGATTSVPTARPGYSTGKRGANGERSGSVRDVPRYTPPRSVPAPSSPRTGTTRESGRASSPPSSSPPTRVAPSSPPPASHPAPSGGSRGGENRGGGSSGGSRGGERR